MTTSSVIAICGVVLVLILGACAFYVIRVLVSIRQLLETGQEILKETKPQIALILKDATESTSKLRDTVARIDKMIKNILSLPDFAKTLTKTFLNLLLSKEKRGSSL